MYGILLFTIQIDQCGGQVLRLGSSSGSAAVRWICRYGARVLRLGCGRGSAAVWWRRSRLFPVYPIFSMENASLSAM